MAASIVSVLVLASAMARVRMGFETTTRPAWAARSSAMAQVLVVASRTTWSSGPRLAAKARSPSGEVAMRPAGRAWPPASMTATSANDLPTSSPIVRTGPSCWWDTHGRHDIYRSALAAHPGGSQGQAR